MSKLLHAFGVRIEGQLLVLAGSCDDATFRQVTTNGLPAGWVAWHVEESECNDPPSEKVRQIRELPQLAVRWQDALKDARAGRQIGTSGYAVQTL